MASKRKKNAAPPDSPPPQKQEAPETPHEPYTDPYSGEELFTPDEQETALAYLAAQQKEQELIDAGWKTIADAAEETGLKNYIIWKRVRKLQPDTRYDFTEVLAREIVSKKGDLWVWRNLNQKNTEYLIHPNLVEILQQEGEKEKQLKAQKWKTTVKTEKKTGLSRAAIITRIKTLNPEEEYSFMEVLTGKTITKKGTEWIYKNPNSQTAEYFIHPDLIEIYRQEVEKESQLKEQGWKTTAEIAQETGLERQTIFVRTKTLDPEKKHSFTEVLTGETVTKKGAKWVYKNPNLKASEVLIHPDLVEIWQQEIEKERQLKEQGWKTVADVAKETGLNDNTIKNRLRKITPKEEYSFTEPITGNIITKKGADWTYKNPNNKNTEYFIHPDFVEILRKEIEKEKQLKEQGWKKTTEVVEKTGLKNYIVQRHLKKINPEEEHSFTEPLTGKEITKEGADWVYQNPNSKSAEYFIHPDLVRILQQEAEVKAAKKAKKGAKSKKIGTLDTEKSPEVADEAAQKKKGKKKGRS